MESKFPKLSKDSNCQGRIKAGVDGAAAPGPQYAKSMRSIKVTLKK